LSNDFELDCAPSIERIGWELNYRRWEEEQERIAQEKRNKNKKAN